MCSYTHSYLFPPNSVIENLTKRCVLKRPITWLSPKIGQKQVSEETLILFSTPERRIILVYVFKF